MGDVIDLDAWRRKRTEPEEQRPRRRRTPGGRGFDDDMARHLSLGLPSPTPDEPRDEDDGA